MFFVSLITGSDAEYSKVCGFASRMYYDRYAVTLSSFPEIFSYTYDNEGTVHGCFGINTGAHTNPLLTETYLPHVETLGQLFGDKTAPRSTFAEFGTRATSKQAESGIFGNTISLALSVEAFLYAYREGMRYALFTSNRTVRRLGHALNIKLTNFGPPNLETKTPEYRENWKHFFEAPQLCWGAHVADAIPGCYAQRKMLQELFVFTETHE